MASGQTLALFSKIQVLVDFNSPRCWSVVVPGLCDVAVLSGTREPRTHGSVPAEAILNFYFLIFIFSFSDLLGRGLVF